ncbi:MAG: hypothetical protein ACOC10_12255 [Bacteroidota bacterium]
MDNYEKLRDACYAASGAFEKIGGEEHKDIRSKLDYCVGSYDYDRNPVGLMEFGGKALEILKEAKLRNPRKVNKKVIADLEKWLMEASGKNKK